MKEENKKVVKSILIGVLIALLLCGVAYSVLISQFMFSSSSQIEEEMKEEVDTEEETSQKTDEEVEEKKENDGNATVNATENTVGQASGSSIVVMQSNGEAVMVDNPNSNNSTTLTVVKDGIRYFKLICPKEDAAAGQSFNDALQMATGYPLFSSDDSASEVTYEVLIGNTNREESTALLQSMKKSGSSFAVQVTDEKIVIVGERDYCLERAVEYLINNCSVSNGTLTAKKGFVYKSNESAFTEAIMSSASLDATTEQVVTIGRPEGRTGVQGGCSDGNYFYQVFIQKDTGSNEANNKCVIAKCSLQTGEIIQTSTDLALNHANDITYNSKLGYLVVCHNNPNRTRVSYVNPSTLELVKSFDIGYKIYSIDYNAKTNRYVVGISGGQSFRILDGAFKAIGSAYQPTGQTSGYTTQGVGSDEDFIYFVLYKQNVIAVYDWSGRFVSLIDLDISESIEPENIFIVNDVIYVGCAGSSGATVYKITNLK